VPGSVVVIGEINNRLDVHAFIRCARQLERRGERRMPSPPLFRQQPVLQNFGQQRVHKPVRTVRADHKHAGVYRLSQEWDDIAARPKRCGDLPKHGRRLGPTRNCDQPRQLARGPRQTLPRVGCGLTQVSWQIGRQRGRIG
jgi:hypothetical protein